MPSSRYMLDSRMHSSSLNSVCPYYTMYPLSFPLSYLTKYGSPGSWVLDPFCGRGTTNYAARMCGMPSVGADSSRIAAAVAKAKLASSTADSVVACLTRILSEAKAPKSVPVGEFWDWAFHPRTLLDLCRVREVLLEDCDSDVRIVLRAIVLGALHGPVNKSRATYLSNQCPRTFAPKPRYSVRFWKERSLKPPEVQLAEVVRIRASWYLNTVPAKVEGQILMEDSRTLGAHVGDRRFRYVITSPPYYGMRTYVPDQWMRNWFLGGPPEVVYGQSGGELAHASPDHFASALAGVWKAAADLCVDDARLLCRFGGIHDRKQDPEVILRKSFIGTGWRLSTIRSAGSSNDGKRQATQFGKRISKPPRKEFDVYARLER